MYLYAFALVALVALGSYVINAVMKSRGKFAVQSLIIKMLRANLTDFPPGKPQQPSSLIVDIKSILTRYKIRIQEAAGMTEDLLRELGREADKHWMRKLVEYHFDQAKFVFGALCDDPNQTNEVDKLVESLHYHLQQCNQCSEKTNLPLKTLESLGTDEDELRRLKLEYHIRRAGQLIAEVRQNPADPQTGDKLHEFYRHAAQADELDADYGKPTLLGRFNTGFDEIGKLLYTWHFRNHLLGSGIKC